MKKDWNRFEKCVLYKNKSFKDYQIYSGIPLEISCRMAVKGNVALSDRLRLQNNFGLSSAADIQRASSLMSRTFLNGFSPRFEKPATAWAQWLSLNSGFVQGFPLKISFLKLKHFHSGSVIIPLLTLARIHGLLLEFLHLTAKISFPGVIM